VEQVKDKFKEVDRRASLRPRNVAREVVASPAHISDPNGTETKKRRVSKSALHSSKPTPEAQSTVRKPLLVYKPKRWLSHGLYAGQDRYFDPRLTEAKNRVKHADRNANDRRKLFPLPMFAGERLLQTGRDFKLPFDIFSPLPPGQPKPDEWRKTNKSE
jgi:histone-lysine N-methyltransferase ASH1L